MNVLDRLLVSIPNYSKIRITYGIDPEIAYLRNEYVHSKIVSIKNLLTGTKFHLDIIRLKWVNEFKQHVLPLLKPVKVFRRFVTFRYKNKAMQTYVECVDYIATNDVIKKVLIELEEKCNLRTVKDPFRTAMASRLLPDASRIVVTHIGAALTPSMNTRANREELINRRYTWRGSLTRHLTLKAIARSRV